ACMHQCPFGAITDKSYLLNVIDILKRKHEGAGYKTYAIVAPSISTQFSYARGEQVIAGLKRLGFDAVVEAALGADMVAVAEAQELAQKGTLVSSCCPAFVEYIQQHFPHLTGYISETPSPMAMTGRYIKEQDPTARTVFIGPCTAKKAEGRRPDVLPFVDSVMTFEELRALFDAREVDITTLEDVPLQDASPWGRRLGKTGGLAGAVKAAWRELNLGEEEPKCASCDGLEQCRIMLLKLGKGVHNVDFIEGMACVGGCIAGAGCQSRAKTGAALLDEHAAASSKTSVTADLPPIPKH
ncbi:MAG: ferredoxin, partial [Clostridia bacterium]|nr:ferredoxin [Clostridia bacterium]